tara:strand:+ start:27596 stop:28063 length:468 start_codon:yes stop_codon:yes gene_type:complete
MAMSLEDFVATKERCENLGSQFGENVRDIPGFIYVGHLYIEDHIGQEAAPGIYPGMYFLLVDRSDYTSTEIEVLEKILFEWAGEEGYLDDDGSELLNEMDQVDQAHMTPTSIWCPDCKTFTLAAYASEGEPPELLACDNCNGKWHVPTIALRKMA